ncbi:toxin-antitoxin system YwqK family antitoxin, partial [Providencia huaxiensis]|uniref:toxin-antitoxin system YwqK family antitoxin n=1 Tax=Providencia huaxiensis TaxID=2027290 RepID=UPI0034E59994
MFKLKPIKSVALLSLILLVSGCQLGGSTNSNSNSDSKFGELSELKTMEFPSTEAPKGLAEGAFETEYDNGQPKFKAWVSKGCLDKYIKTYYENGKPESLIQLKNCKIDGTVRNYHENGKPESLIQLKNCKIDGTVRNYHE